tara:strand:+ start:363 stop:620 length:258 start_codon:yes stop_codon:yes gene_type:complete
VSKRITGKTQMPIKLSKLEAEMILMQIYEEDDRMFEHVHIDHCIASVFGIYDLGIKNYQEECRKIYRRSMNKLIKHVEKLEKMGA